jgi:hypothetical protein
MSTTISVKYPIIEAKVVRGKDWCYDEQDGGEGKTGVIVDKLKYDWVRVLWENGNKDDYRIGNEGKYDLYFATEKDALLQEAMERFPSGCSYEDIATYDIYINVEYDYPFWYSDNQIALKYKKGLIYDNGKWAERTDVPVKEERVEVFPGIYVGDIIVSLKSVHPVRNIGDIFKVSEKSHKGNLYCSIGWSSNLKETWRLATPDEILFYNNGGKNINDMTKKELSPLEMCKQMFPVGTVVEMSQKLQETITQSIFNTLKEYDEGSISSYGLRGWLYDSRTKQYAKIIKNKTINTNQNEEKHTSTSSIESRKHSERGIEVSRPYIKIPTTVRSGGAGLKSANRTVRLTSNRSYNQKGLSIS